MSSYVKSINAFSTGLLSNSPEGPPHELQGVPQKNCQALVQILVPTGPKS